MFDIRYFKRPSGAVGSFGGATLRSEEQRRWLMAIDLLHLGMNVYWVSQPAQLDECAPNWFSKLSVRAVLITANASPKQGTLLMHVHFINPVPYQYMSRLS